MGIDLATWKELAGPARAALIADAAAIDPGSVADVDRVRKQHGCSAALMQAALNLAVARRKLEIKWPGRAASLWADLNGAEMASSALAARYKSARFAGTLGRGSPVVDLCCGIGGDAMGLADAGLRVTAVDLDPARSWMAGLNAACPSLAVDVTDPSVPLAAFHLDPARRDETGTHRLWQIDDHQPGPSVWRKLIEQRRAGVGTGGAIKLGPGLDIAAACRVLPPGTPHEIEIISERGRLTQAVLWLGTLAKGHIGSRVATLLTDVGATSLRLEHPETDGAAEPPAGPLRRYLIEADASIERAGLLGLACRKDGRMTGIHPGLGLLTSDAAPHSPLFTAFAVQAHMPWIEKNVRAWLKEHSGGIVEVKTRGRAVDPNVMQKHLRGEGATPYTVFVFRMGRSIEAVITRREAVRA